MKQNKPFFGAMGFVIFGLFLVYFNHDELLSLYYYSIFEEKF